MYRAIARDGSRNSTNCHCACIKNMKNIPYARYTMASRYSAQAQTVLRGILNGRGRSGCFMRSHTTAACTRTWTYLLQRDHMLCGRAVLVGVERYGTSSSRTEAQLMTLVYVMMVFTSKGCNNQHGSECYMAAGFCPAARTTNRPAESELTPS